MKSPEKANEYRLHAQILFKRKDYSNSLYLFERVFIYIYINYIINIALLLNCNPFLLYNYIII